MSDESKAKQVDRTDLERVRDPHVRMSLELQQAFGLRREEAIKFSPSYADRGDCLVLKDTWTKGGKAREIPVRTPVQREVLDPRPPLGGIGFPDPEGSQLPPAAANLRAPHGERRAIEAPRSAPCLRATAI